MNFPLDPAVGKSEPAITQLFGANPHDYARFGYPGHNGLDLWTGSEPPYVYSIEKGAVEKVGWEERGYGKYVVIVHEGGWRTYYAHLSQVHVLPGSRLAASAALGLMGATGFATGLHLHLGVRYAAQCNPPYRGFVDPLPLLRGEPLRIFTGKAYEDVTFYPEGASAPKPPGANPALPALVGVPPALFVARRGSKTVYRMRRYF